MRVQLLSFPGCPNASAAREALRRARAYTGLPQLFEEVDVTSPDAPAPLRDWGSPTILVDERDVAGEAPSGPSCRLYDARGIPDVEVIHRALDSARAKEDTHAR